MEQTYFHLRANEVNPSLFNYVLFAYWTFVLVFQPL